MPMKMLNEVSKTIEKFNMLSVKEHIMIGLSGGPDSVCLSVVLSGLKKQFDLTLSAVYIDHGLRPDETGKEKDFCRSFCDEHGIIFITKSINLDNPKSGKSSNLQEAARELRYKIFREVAIEAGATCIALGHNADDQAETVFMRLLRGTGRKGLSGIPPVRGEIIRPLIEIERKQIEEFLVGANRESPLHTQPYMIDSSNLKDKYFRNWIRHSLMDKIKEKNPAVIEDICRSAEILRDEDDYLEIIVTKTLMRLISRKSDSTIQLFLVPLQAIEIPVLRRVLRRAVDSVTGLRGISFINIEDIIGLIRNGKAGDSLNLPKEIRVIREYSLLIITTEKPVVLSEYELQLSGEVVIKEAGIILKAIPEEHGAESGEDKNTVFLDLDSIQFPLKIRGRETGDIFYPVGFGRKKKLQDFFVDEKIPREKRAVVPLVLSGKDIMWIAGYRADDRFKVTEDTKNIVRLVMTKIALK